MPDWKKITFAMEEVQYSQCYTVIYQSYSSVKAVFQIQNHKKTVKVDNRTYDQLTYTCKLSAKPIIQMRNWINILIKFPCYFKANQVKSVG